MRGGSEEPTRTVPDRPDPHDPQPDRRGYQWRSLGYAWGDAKCRADHLRHGPVYFWRDPEHLPEEAMTGSPVPAVRPA
jgi:hypothetical protein